MTLQDILTPEITAVLGTLLGSGGTALISKWQNKKSDNITLAQQQSTLLKTVNNDLNEVVKQLQAIACYRDNCNKRINGETEAKP